MVAMARIKKIILPREGELFPHFASGQWKHSAAGEVVELVCSCGQHCCMEFPGAVRVLRG